MNKKELIEIIEGCVINSQVLTEERVCFDELRKELNEELPEQLILSGVSHQREQFADLLIWYKYNVGRDNIKNCKELAEEYINL